MNNFNKYLIDCNSSTIKAIKKINLLKGGSLIVTKKKNFLVGVLSSKDLRRAIELNTITNKTINKIYNPNPKFIFLDEINFKIEKINNIIDKFNIVPVVNRKTKKIVNILTKDKVFFLKNKKKKKLNVSVVIMAGGKGSRLMPYTSILPKPLLPINFKPTIHHILDKFVKYSPKKIFITMNYKSEILSAFLKEIKKKLGNNLIITVKEKRPLGTIGSLFLIKKKLKENFFLTNCDTIINADYEKIFLNHKKNNNDITIVTALKKMSIPYGVCAINNNNFEMREKPKLTFNVNTGFYIIKRDCLNVIKKYGHLDFNEFLLNCKKENKKINIFKIKEKTWIDIGQMNEYKMNLNKKV